MLQSRSRSGGSRALKPQDARRPQRPRHPGVPVDRTGCNGGECAYARSAGGQKPSLKNASVRPAVREGARAHGFSYEVAHLRQVALHDLPVSVIADAGEGNKHQKEDDERPAPTPRAVLHLQHFFLERLNVQVGLAQFILHTLRILQLLVHLPQVLVLLIYRLARHRKAGNDRSHLKLKHLLQLVHVCVERLDGSRLRAQHARVVALKPLGRPQVVLLDFELQLLLLRGHPVLVVGDRVVNLLERAHREVDDVVVVNEVACGRRDGEVALLDRHHDVAHLEAVVPLALAAAVRLLDAHL
mmetsp:Transcript_29143/g.61271  ORF Transcript_29143/g.61271 Transcript_29143/m.61271 type:complete len:299 (+) Transcript_29143:523-1419(+)